MGIVSTLSQHMFPLLRAIGDVLFLHKVNFFKPSLTFPYHVLFGRPLPSHLKIYTIIFFCSYAQTHLGTFAAISIYTVKPSIVISSLVFFCCPSTSLHACLLTLLFLFL